MYVNKASLIVSPVYNYKTESPLYCARECLADSLCKGFALYRSVEPAGSATCRRYDELSAVVYDETSVTYFTFNSTLPSP